MLQMLPNWYYGFLPESLWPNRPREFYICELDILPIPAGVNVKEVVFSKKTDVVVFGGSLLRTDVTGANQFNPRGGTWARFLIHMFNAASNEQYTPIGDDGNPVVPVENLFSVWGYQVGNGGFVNAGARQPCFWPQPIVIEKGGALTLEMQDIGAGGGHARFAFWTGLFYKREEAVAA